MKKTANILKGLLISLASLTVAFLAIALPFRLFTVFDGAQLRTVFLCEVSVYFIVFMLFLVSKERKRIRKEKEQKRREARRLKFQQAQKEYYDLAA